MKSISLIAGIILLSACSSEPKKIHLRTEKGVQTETVNVDANSMLTMDIQGMSCEMSCGGSIRKALKETGAVERVRYDFVEGEKVQKAYVSFDSSKISADEMINIVEKLNDQQFSVGKNSVKKIDDTSQSSTSESSNDASDANIEMNEGGFHIPNLIHLLKNLVVS